jgi:hypothetical protein
LARQLSDLDIGEPVAETVLDIYAAEGIGGFVVGTHQGVETVLSFALQGGGPIVNIAFDRNQINILAGKITALQTAALDSNIALAEISLA